MCQLIVDSGRPQLRSTHAIILTVLRTNTRQGDGSFSVAGQRILNSLPALLRQPDIEFGHILDANFMTPCFLESELSLMEVLCCKNNNF